MNRCLYCRCGYHGECEKAKDLGLGKRFPDVAECNCDTYHPKKKENEPCSPS